MKRNRALISVFGINIGLAFLRIDDKEQGIKSLETALQYEPRNEKARRLLELVSPQGGRDKSAS